MLFDGTNRLKWCLFVEIVGKQCYKDEYTNQ